MKIRVISFIVAALVILAWPAESRGQGCGCDPGPYPEPPPPSETIIYLPVVSHDTVRLDDPLPIPDPDKKPVRPPTADKLVRPPPSSPEKKPVRPPTTFLPAISMSSTP